MAAIQRQLGEGDEGKAAEIAELDKAIAEARHARRVDDQARKELRRLERMPEAAGEYGMMRTYLDWLVELPWALPEEKPIDIAEARRVLDDDHFGLEKIKRRILEYLAVRKLAPNGRAPILCFVGPAGRRQDLARPVDREGHRAEIRPGEPRRRARRSRNPRPPAHLHRRAAGQHHPGDPQGRRARLRDDARRDRQGRRELHGDPSAALLEVLDPEQNNTFRDNYLGVPFDLSRVVFISTANMLDTIPGPLRDRMEIISLPGYTAGREVPDRQALSRPAPDGGNGLKPGRPRSTTPRSRAIIEHYTREAGVRSLEREIGRALRQVATRIAEGEQGPIAHRARPTSARSSGRRSSRTRWRCGSACRASRRGSPGRRSAATSCSSRRRRCRARGG